jgi:hypothetical protein
MVTVSRRGLLPFLAPVLVPTACFMLASNPIPAGGTLFFLPATTPTEGGHI